MTASDWSALAADRAEPPAVSSSDTEAQAGRTPGRVQTVLLATDLTPVSDAATHHAVDLAATLGARLLVVNVIDPARRGPGDRDSRVDQMRAQREPALLDIVGSARSRGVSATFLLWTGEPGRSIVSAAEAEGVDMVVVGTRALDRAGRFLLGSVSDYVVHHAACPVLVAR
jgi:nucleotide-binding universal stress UspA family protein